MEIFTLKQSNVIMKKLSIVVLVVFSILLQTNEIFAHKRAKYNIVIDTDAGVDDFRAITIFCASPDFNINCITTVDGVLDPQTGANYISNLMKIYHHEGIPIGAGINNKVDKKYEKHAVPYWQNLFPKIEPVDFESAVDVMGQAIANEQGKTIIIACGPLSNIAEMLEKYPDNAAKIQMVIWYAHWDNTPKGYNHEKDETAYGRVMAHEIIFKMISSDSLKYSSEFDDVCLSINSVYAQTFCKFNGSTKWENTNMWDELLPLSLINSNLFTEYLMDGYTLNVDPQKNIFPDIIISSVLNSERPTAGVVFNELPSSGFMLMLDVESIAPELIAKHGYTEFKITSLTSEIHSHMGIYSILGAKTGLRIMEYLHAGLDEIEIVSYAGFEPPISCFNDGLQIGTGSTIGYGTISVDTTQGIKPAVLVKYNGRKILFSIKPELTTEIRNDVGKLIKDYGLESEMYWIKLRELSISKYWLGKSRFDILDIQELE
jgi:pyrimidine-specific ribonucleoside hydrolase